MRTTLSIDDDILAAVKELAATERRSAGEVISSLTRKALMSNTSSVRTRNGIALLPLRPDATPVTTALIRRLDEELR